MLSEGIIKKLKQSNVSVDSAKTKIRVQQLWKEASSAQQGEVLDLAGIKRQSVYRVHRTGNVSARLAIALAQTLNVDPFYITGQNDLREVCSDAALVELLTLHKYTALVKEHTKEQRKLVRTVTREAATEETEAWDEPEAAMPEAEPAVDQSLLDALTEEELTLLLRSVLLRAKAGGKHAELADAVKRLLLS
mgnify:CR=1 FL=1